MGTHYFFNLGKNAVTLHIKLGLPLCLWLKLSHICMVVVFNFQESLQSLSCNFIISLNIPIVAHAVFLWGPVISAN